MLVQGSRRASLRSQQKLLISVLYALDKRLNLNVFVQAWLNNYFPMTKIGPPEV